MFFKSNRCMSIIMPKTMKCAIIYCKMKSHTLNPVTLKKISVIKHLLRVFKIYLQMHEHMILVYNLLQ